MIEKFLLLRESLFVTSHFDLNAIPKVLTDMNSLSKTITKIWNQVNLDYFHPHINKTYGKSEIILKRQDVYYRNIMVFVQHF